MADAANFQEKNKDTLKAASLSNSEPAPAFFGDKQASPFLNNAAASVNPFSHTGATSPFVAIQKKNNPFVKTKPPGIRQFDFGSGQAPAFEEEEHLMNFGEAAFETSGEVMGELEDVSSTGLQAGMGIPGDLFAFGKAMRDFMKSDDPLEKTLAIFDASSAVASMASQTAGLIEEGMGKDNPVVSNVLGAVGKGIGAVKGIIELIKQIKSFKEAVESDDPASNKFKAGLELAGKIGEAGKGVAEVVSSVYKALSIAAPGALEQAIPGFSIVIAAIDIIKQGMDMVQAIKSYRAMSSLKGDLTNELKTQSVDVFLPDQVFRSKNRTDEAKLKQVAESTTNPQAGLAQQFDLTRELKKVNRKRIIRMSLLIAADAASIAGEIATLTGLGGGAGLGLKLGAIGLKGGMKIARIVKQKFRDSGYGDQSKTSKAKHDTRVKHIKLIFKMIDTHATQHATTPSSAAAQKSEQTIKAIVEAVGVGYSTLMKYKTTPDKAAKLLYTALKKREADDEVSAE
ncbi:MAG: hypothetical protein HC913_15875 [Microscillaceae bacterium]|nr:hypothetical protein [Microscillaceae bacterium]